MKILPHQSIVFKFSGMLLLSITISLLIFWSARADVGVRPVLPGGSNIQPEVDTPIQMASEVVEMSVRAATAADNALIQLNPQSYGLDVRSIWYPAVAEVQADFTMRNPTDEEVSMPVWFPLASSLGTISWELNPDEIVPRIESFEVSVDGNPIEYTVSELPNPKGADRPPLPWASFPVTFPAGTETNIHVSYLLPLQTAVKGSELGLYYVFQTGAGWAGSIGQADLIVNLPYPASQETMAGISPGRYTPPYNISSFSQADLPAGGVFTGNQAHWNWKDFEPGPQDDFAIWLIDPAQWDALSEARNAVTVNPESGDAWLKLAEIYRLLATAGYNSPSAFTGSYLPLGLEAYQKAADLLPENPVPHTGLGLLTLAPYLSKLDAPADKLQFVQDQLALAQQLEGANPSSVENGAISSWFLEDIMRIYTDRVATATAEWVSTSTAVAKATKVASTQTARVASTPTPQNTSTTSPTHIPTATFLPPTATAAQSEERSAGGQSLVWLIPIIAAMAIIVGYLIWRRIRGSGH
jgi:Domain of unknown function (DUF4424)